MKANSTAASVMKHELTAALLSQEITIENTRKAQQAIWCAFGRAWREYTPEHPFSRLEIERACRMLLGFVDTANIDRQSADVERAVVAPRRKVTRTKAAAPRTA